MSTYGTVSAIEIIWTAIALAGAVLATINVREAAKDLAALDEAPRIVNGRRAIADTALRVEVSRLLCQIIFAAIGVIAMLLPEGRSFSERPLKVALFSLFIQWGLMIAVVLITYQSLGWRLLRSQLPTARGGVEERRGPEEGRST